MVFDQDLQSAAEVSLLIPAFAILSEEELRIVGRVAEGKSNAEISQDLRLSFPQVKNALHEIYNKTGMNGRMELALWYVSHLYS